MALARLSFECGESSLDVHRFQVREALSELFEITVVAHSPNEDIMLGDIVGRPISFCLGEPSLSAQSTAKPKIWSGIVRAMQQEGVEQTGISIYRLHIAPTLWLLSQRIDQRIFQYRSAPNIVRAILAEWGIEARWNIQSDRFPTLECRVQYQESDLDFVRRLLAESGISFFFGEGEDQNSVLVFSDAPERAEPRKNSPIAFVDHPNRALEKEFVSELQIAQEVRASKLSILGHDFRRASGFRLSAEASSRKAGEKGRLEHHLYEPNAFVRAEGKTTSTPIADDRAIVQSDEKAGKLRAEHRLARERSQSSSVSFQSNIGDLGAGQVFCVARHPRSDLGPERRLLITQMLIEQSTEQAIACRGKAAFADIPYAPPQAQKPRISGVQSAIVVGPRSSTKEGAEEIHTDEFGRIRVQFLWDREGVFDDRSSCWLRVSQGWAGAGFGMMVLPRVGQEVLVGFFEGDPDQPIVVGRVYNNTERVPYKLPEHKTKSTWKSASTPGSAGFNEIMFEDAKGAELVYVQAERNLEQLVKVDESISVGRNRDKRVGVNESIAVGANRAARIGAVDSAWVGERHSVTMEQRGGAGPTVTEMVDGKIELTTGEATIRLEGPNITLEAAAGILMKAGAEIALGAGSHVRVEAAVNMTLMSGAKLVVQADDGDVVIQGGPLVQINPEDRRWRRSGMEEKLDVKVPPTVDLAMQIEEAEEHGFHDPEAPDWLREKMRSGDWDFGGRDESYKDFESFHLGVTGAAMRLPEGTILRQAGQLKRERGEVIEAERGDPGNGLWGGQEPYGLPARQYVLIKKGYAFYAEQNRKGASHGS